MSTIAIIGASRGVGLETVKAGLAAGHTVRAFARSAASIPLDDARLIKMPGDALSPADLAKAVSGAEAVIQTLGVASLTELAFGTTLFSKSTRMLVDAMQANGPKRLIAVTGAGAGNSRGRINPLYDYLLFPILLQRVYADKDIAEDMIQKSSLDWTIVRPGLLTNAPATGKIRALAEMKDWGSGSITRADTATYLVQQVAARDMIHKTPLLIS